MPAAAADSAAAFHASATDDRKPTGVAPGPTPAGGVTAAPSNADMYPDTLSLIAPDPAKPTPRVWERALPTYPPAASEAGVQGTVRVLATVSTTGSVIATSIVRGIPELNDEAIDTVRRTRFVPLVIDGRRCEFRVVMAVAFILH